MGGIEAVLPLARVFFNEDPRGEEYAPLAPRLDIEMGDSEWGLEQECRHLEPAESETGVRFSVFVDGVQRTVMVGRLRTPAFSQVPLHVFEVAAGYVWRGDDRRVRAGGWVRLRGMVAPFAAAFGDEGYAERVARALVGSAGKRVEPFWRLGEDPLLPLRPEAPDFWVFDSSLVGIGGSSGQLIAEAELANEARVRTLALAKVAHGRQVMELGVHLALRAGELGVSTETFVPSLRKEVAGREPWVMHDGPLFFTARRRKMVAEVLGLSPMRLDDALLRRSVGYVKNHRLRPADVECVLGTPAGRMTEARAHRAVEPPDRYLRWDLLEEDERTYALDVYSFYLRMWRDEDLRRAGVSGGGLVRVQFGASAIAELGERDRNAAAARIAIGVYRERVPLPRFRFQPYPIDALERFLRGKLTVPERMRAEVLRWFG